MQQRHRVPTIFSIYMLDVICCALGCVVLLWQVAYQEAEEQTTAAIESRKEADSQLAAAKLARTKFELSHQLFVAASSELADLKDLLAALRQKQDATALNLARTQKERDEALLLAAQRSTDLDQSRKSLSLTEEELKKLEKNLARMVASAQKTDANLTGQLKLNADLLARIALANKDVSALKKDLATREAEIDASAKKSKDQVALLKLSEENARKLEKLLATFKDDYKDAQDKLKLTELQLKMRAQALERVQGEIKDLLAFKDKLGKQLSSAARELLDAKNRSDALTSERNALKELLLSNSRDLSSATTALGTLKAEKNKLNQRVVDLETEVEQRFAGIPLSGESVVFLIDVSGSMVMKDSKTEDPDKWPFLCDTLMRLMRSITTMKRFQVILFSDKTSYLFGNRDYWLKYEGRQTAKAAHDALRKFEVGGNTNMHDGFDEAFRFRKIGLDTIYLFSDGLPNVGEGLPADVRNPTEEQLNHHLSKFIREKLTREWNRPIANKAPVRINSIGFYFESPDVGAFLWALSRDHRGNFVGVR